MLQLLVTSEGKIVVAETVGNRNSGYLEYDSQTREWGVIKKVTSNTVTKKLASTNDLLRFLNKNIKPSGNDRSKE